MNRLRRMLVEYRDLSRVLDRADFISLVKATVIHAPEIARTGKLTSVDAAMSRNMTAYFDRTPIRIPLADIDAILSVQKDNPTFGNIREIFARNCYLNALRLKRPVSAVLDLGANRGIFSILAFVALKAEVVVGVEPNGLYSSVFSQIMEANHCSVAQAPRYSRFISSPSMEQRDPSRNVSIQTIMREQNISRFNLVKMDIEGHEIGVFAEPEWLANVDTLTVELHPSQGDLTQIPKALRDYGFRFLIQDQGGTPVGINSGTFLFASRTGDLSNEPDAAWSN